MECENENCDSIAKKSSTAAAQLTATASAAATRHIWWIATSNLGKIITLGVCGRKATHCVGNMLPLLLLLSLLAGHVAAVSWRSTDWLLAVNCFMCEHFKCDALTPQTLTHTRTCNKWQQEQHQDTTPATCHAPAWSGPSLQRQHIWQPSDSFCCSRE